MQFNPLRRINQPTNQRPHIVSKEIPGAKSMRMRAREDEMLAPGLQAFSMMAGIVVDQAQGSAITDIDGNTFIDLIGGIGVGGIGHSHPTYIREVTKQLSRATIGSFTSEARVNFFERACEHRLHPSLKRIQLYSSGAEAVESALRLAKAYTDKFEFVSFWGGFHGKTMGALSLMGLDYKAHYGPLVPGNHIIPYANCYRCPFKLKHPSCSLHCVEFARKQLKVSVSKGIAAFIIEPMQGTAGNVIPPADFLIAISELAKEWDALLIADEMITGFGRTGRYWGSEHASITPDILTIGKQFGGGFPISGIISTDEITSAYPWSIPSGSSSSYGGNPLAAAAAAASLKIIDEEGLVENSEQMGSYFLSRLSNFVDRYPFVGEVRGAGLFLGIEMVEDQESQEPLSSATSKRIFHECLKRGLLTMSYSPHFRLQPAMTIDRETIDNAVAILEEVFDLIKIVQ
ncbi:MAG: aminotransferase class III-fold pyridoxal phosphate-dependent enzyme [Oligoflexia bacterium]|nr:aminotransferase class III-fold pyridoxal phosphate-dependent enzyme [Oligoflexia bacterium]MBF0365425.1 aminotransferase class III-fold pyridoxal phosphate-dependent enzyme [Oligoflexia bacterium]